MTAASLMKTFLALLTAILAVAAFTIGALSLRFWLFLKTPGGDRREFQSVTVREGMSGMAIARLLADKGIVADAGSFYVLCRLRRVDSRLKAGDYAFLPLKRPEEILEQMVSGRVKVQRVTLPEGATVRQLARIFHDQGLAAEHEVLQMASDPDFIYSLGVESGTLEGYLFPETYFFQASQSLPAMLTMMVQEFRRRLPEGWREQLEGRGLTLHEWVTIASMVEKEAVVDEERPIIAGVFYNRLRENMPLQSDPTAVYDLPGFSGPITPDHLKRSSPYNTYRNRGLPVGPICNPGARSLHAALHPASVPYRYFVSNNDGTHHFSETYGEHRQAVVRTRQKRGGTRDSDSSTASETEGQGETGKVEAFNP